MRPIERGPCPTVIDAAGTVTNRVFSDYGDAKPYLQCRIGKYCSYCEMALTNAACHVEHIYAKDLPKYHGLIKQWDNFLLSCQHCNSTKGVIDVAVTLPYMPHKHNTFLLFDYIAGGLILLNPAFASLYPQGKILLEMVGIDRRPGHPNYSAKDDRWLNRKQTWDIAQRYLVKYQSGSADVETIVDLALARGFFSVWMAVFQSHSIIRQFLIYAFLGTATICFDGNTLPIKRNGVDI